jgi:hypothetical protein
VCKKTAVTAVTWLQTAFLLAICVTGCNVCYGCYACIMHGQRQSCNHWPTSPLFFVQMAFPEGFKPTGVAAAISQEWLQPDCCRTDPERAQDASQIDGNHGTSVVKKASAT